jgi:hypothetical protein
MSILVEELKDSLENERHIIEQPKEDNIGPQEASAKDILSQ